ncbi:hypothetical protein [Rhizobium rhizogenes]|uniref:hypothetical protein n=1 Tax=Rhizobium rhizogenes TaxID=359 RepID=UPI00080F7B6D|nr:hypothetical protein [Rhizobium rhizogenes]NTI41415.1 hypothetical protein [Rhizobium rhizogenes]OCJ25552.1 hypothetical protein A6U88_03630 [Agrobacterium sp. B131/95]
MLHFQEESAILFWTKETDPTLAVPSSVQRLLSVDMHQRVVRVTARRDGWADIHFGPEEFQVREDCLRFIEPLLFHVGDGVKFSGGQGTIRDVIWHFKDGEPNYYLEQEGKKLSKRYLTSDLARAS